MKRFPDKTQQYKVVIELESSRETVLPVQLHKENECDKNKECKNTKQPLDLQSI